MDKREKEFVVQRRIFAWQVGVVSAANHQQAMKKARKLNKEEIDIIRPCHGEWTARVRKKDSTQKNIIVKQFEESQI